MKSKGRRGCWSGIREVIRARGLPCAFCSDRGSYYWTTPEAGGLQQAT
jgi:hypothetical protein